MLTFIMIIDRVYLPRSIVLASFAIFFISVVLVRIIFLSLLNFLKTKDNLEVKEIIIYGAGASGRRLLNNVNNRSDFKIRAFIDDDPNLTKMSISGIEIYSRYTFNQYFKDRTFDEIWIAITSIDEIKKEFIFNYLLSFSKNIKIIPNFNELLFNGKIDLNLKNIEPEEYLGREKIDINSNYFNNFYFKKSIIITGAGGSIGSELCRQLINHNPEKLVLLDNSEINLFNIEREMNALCKKNNIVLVTYLGSVCDSERIEDIFNKHSIDIIIHSAAFKHVNLVESNIVEGFRNNVIGTYTLKKIAIKCKVQKLILVSTDKAVRPSNIMGATKRLSELIMQSNKDSESILKTSIVRFGNVLGSSGSVIPIFHEQIKNGGPLTVTGENMERYFMAINEAAQLVLVAGSIGTNGEVYLLDMGKPVKIINLARNMLKLYNLKEKNDSNPRGDIAIKIIEKLPSEKLHEELLVSNDSVPTSHPKVMMEKVDSLSEEDMVVTIKKINDAINEYDDNKLKNIAIDCLKDHNLS
tara:strand:- start:4095 stop:5669 length:1575 start_codon:yes stop_codon:yes gene_type:complete